MASSTSPSPALKVFVALTPVLGTVLFPLVVALLMVRSGIGTGVLAAVVLGSVWFVTMLRTAEMPGHD
jgi:hypothetical protein